MRLTQRLQLIKLTVLIGLLTSIILSHPLWAGDRWFPKTTLIEDYFGVPYPYDYIQLSVLILLIVFSFSTQKKFPTVLLIIFSVEVEMSFNYDPKKWQNLKVEFTDNQMCYINGKAELT